MYRRTVIVIALGSLIVASESAFPRSSRMAQLDLKFRQVLTRTVSARGAELDRCETELKSLDPQLRRAQEDLTKALVAIKESYKTHVSIPVQIQGNGPDLFTGALQCGPHQARGQTQEEVTRQLQAMVDAILD